MSINVEEILASVQAPEAKCDVFMDGETDSSTDFVAVLSGEDGNASIFYNTDALTLGMAMKMVAQAFVDAMDELTTSECEEVRSILNEVFNVEEAE